MSVCLQEHTEDGEIPMIKLVLTKMGTNVTTRKFDMEAEAYLGGIYLQHLKFKGQLWKIYGHKSMGGQYARKTCHQFESIWYSEPNFFLEQRVC